MAMTNYPYPTSFLKKLPAWPANSSCNEVKDVRTYDEDIPLFTGVRKAAMYYYNYKDLEKCNDIFNSDDFDEVIVLFWVIFLGYEWMGHSCMCRYGNADGV